MEASMKATEKRSATHSGGQLGLGRQFAWWATEGEVNMAMPAPAPVPVTIPCAPQNVTVASPGSPPAGSPLSAPLVTRATGTFNYNLGPFRATWQASFTNSYHYALPTLAPVYYVNPTAPVSIVDDLGLSYRFRTGGHNLQAFLNITNIFNQVPNYAAATGAAVPGNQTPLYGSPSPLGRYFTGGVRFTF